MIDCCQALLLDGAVRSDRRITPIGRGPVFHPQADPYDDHDRGGRETKQYPRRSRTTFDRPPTGARWHPLEIRRHALPECGLGWHLRRARGAQRLTHPLVKRFVSHALHSFITRASARRSRDLASARRRRELITEMPSVAAAAA